VFNRNQRRVREDGTPDWSMGNVSLENGNFFSKTGERKTVKELL
jgi:hypothetical protein